jgi:predicted secreted protein
MSLSLGISVYFVIWWVTGSMVMPFGHMTQVETGSIVPGTEPGAPVAVHLGKKFIANTLLAAAVWGIVDAAYIYLYLDSH